MSSTEELLASARRSEKITSLAGNQAQGAEGYLQAFAGMADSNPDMRKRSLRRLSMRYLTATASLWSNEEYRAGAELAQSVVKDLQK